MRFPSGEVLTSSDSLPSLEDAATLSLPENGHDQWSISSMFTWVFF